MNRDLGQFHLPHTAERRLHSTAEALNWKKAIVNTINEKTSSGRMTEERRSVECCEAR